MFEYANTIDFSNVLIGLIWSLVFGISAGNYACSLVHRLPRSLGILEKKPYCGSCNTMLATKDLFPLFSALLLNHKCRYCGAPIPKSHFYTELLLGILFCMCFLQFGFSEEYFLIVLLGSMLTVLASIEFNEGKVDWRVLIAAVVVGIVYRTLHDATIYDAFFGALVGLVLGCALFRKGIEKRGHIYVPPLPALLIATGSLCVGINELPMFLIGFGVYHLLFRLLMRGQKVRLTIPFGFAVIVSLLLTFNL